MAFIFGYNFLMSILIDNLVRSRRKTVALVVEPDGSLTVRAPLHLPDVKIHQFIESHHDWIIRHQTRARATRPAPVKRFVEGETFLYLGKPYPLAFVPSQRSSLVFTGTVFRMAESALPKAQEAFERWYKTQANLLLSERVLTFTKLHGFKFTKMRISSARTRWGSCSSTGTLSFTFRLVMAPPEVVDYVVLHELVHTRVRNHSKMFWARLAELMPVYKVHVAWLKKNGRFLM
jgi:predicted metal-dependent hydrolase